jgi:2'-5' RNA ligase
MLKGRLSLMKVLESISEENKKGKMIALFVPNIKGNFDSLKGEPVPVEDRHITLGLLHGDEEEDRKLQPVLKDLAAQMEPVEVSLGKLGSFPPNEHNHNKHVLWAEPDSDSLGQMHDFLFSILKKHGIKIDNGSFDFKPHVTLKYCDEDPSQFIENFNSKARPGKIRIENLSLASGGNKYHFKMGTRT